MKRKQYAPPSTQVVGYRQQTGLLAGSVGVQSTHQGYGPAVEYNWGESE